MASATSRRSSGRILYSATFGSFALCGVLTALGNALGLVHARGWIFPRVDHLGGLIATSLLLAALSLLPVVFSRQAPTAATTQKSLGKRIWDFCTSLRLTIYLLGASTVLIFFGTLDQVHDGIYLTQKRYFEHALVVWSYPAQWQFGEALGWFRLSIPGGYLLGPLLLLNLFCAHFKYYRTGWRKIGIALIHGGLVVLLLGQFVAQVAQKDYFLWLTEGESNNYLESFHEDELVIIDKSDPEVDRVVSWPVTSFQRRETTLRHPSLPFTLQVVGFQPNAALIPGDQAPPEALDAGLSAGIGAERNLRLIGLPPTYADGERNRTTAIVDVNTENGSLGRWVVSNVFRQKTPMQRFTEPQSFEYRGKTYEIALRFKRAYLPATLELINFEHERYPGTEIPFNFSSEVNIIDSQAGTQRSTLIYMNHPLRFADFTFYQASFGNNDTASMFQVVRNPGRWLPYVACVLMTVGLLLQFLLGLIHFAGRRNRSASQMEASA